MKRTLTEGFTLTGLLTSLRNTQIVNTPVLAGGPIGSVTVLPGEIVNVSPSPGQLVNV